MIRFIFIIGLLFLAAGCGSTDEVTNGNTGNEELEETTSPSIDLADFSTKVEIEPTKEKATFQMTFTNNSEEVADLTFSSGQKFEVVVSDNAGDEVYRYSDGKMFTMALVMQKLEAGDKLTFQDEWDYTKEGKKVEAGDYRVVATVIPIEINGKKVDKGTFVAEGLLTIEKSVENTETEASESEVDSDNPAFRNIKSTGENGEYIITGEARVFEASFMYSVEDGHNELIKETPFQANEGAPSWSAFELKVSIPKDKLPSNGTITAHIFERSAKDGSIVNSYYVPLQQFK
ncbi:BsuPI-related putative proteinase inhibitor [Bacillus sp. DJP31]|uniref:BsuPI-related putative proteinase inhibitor n=1 Tax=Bacillus sp. DJP31 TaxID=3409789 RepID=UPI003BB7AB21